MTSRQGKCGPAGGSDARNGITPITIATAAEQHLPTALGYLPHARTVKGSIV